MDAWTTALKQQFEQTFGAGGGQVRIIRAPGRVNLIGEHTDYNEGFVFPMAIEPEMRLACRPREDGKVRLASSIHPGQIVEFSVQAKIQPGEPRWANYARGVAAELEAGGVPLSGMDVLMINTLPVGGGLSSSAAFEVGIAVSFLTLGGLEMDLGRMALLCQKAEHEFAGVPCGIMDQTIVSSAKAGHAMLLDCRDLSRQFIPLDPSELRVVIANSMVKHNLASGEYAKRRKQCEQAVAYFSAIDSKVRSLRDVTSEQVEIHRFPLGGTAYARAKHVTSENERTAEAARLLEKRQYEEFGELMLQSHRSLRLEYEVSCPELDYLVNESMKVKGVYGARMTGGGFGGCIVALVQPRAVQPLTQHLKSTYKQKFNLDPDVFATTATAGASVVE